MVSQQLVYAIQYYVNRGTPPWMIRRLLVNAGWPPAEVDAALPMDGRPAVYRPAHPSHTSGAPARDRTALMWAVLVGVLVLGLVGVIASVYMEGTPPTITIEGVEAGAVYATAVTPKVTIEDAHLSVRTVTLNGEPYESGTEVSDEGDHTLTVVATDSAGNEGTKAFSFTIDRTGPKIKVSGIKEGGTFDQEAMPFVTVDDYNLRVKEVLLNGEPFESGTWVTEPGKHELEITAEDEAGNTATRTVTFTIKGRPVPSATPSPTPRDDPSPSPTKAPSPSPTKAPSPSPTKAPSPTPTKVPSPSPSPTKAPLPTPTSTPEPTPEPSPSPTAAPWPSETPPGEPADCGHDYACFLDLAADCSGAAVNVTEEGVEPVETFVVSMMEDGTCGFAIIYKELIVGCEFDTLDGMVGLLEKLPDHAETGDPGCPFDSSFGDCEPTGDWAAASHCEYDASLIPASEGINDMADDISDSMRARILMDIQTKNEKVMLSIPSTIRMEREWGTRDIYVAINNIVEEERCFCVYPHLAALDGQGSLELQLDATFIDELEEMGLDDLLSQLRAAVPAACLDGPAECSPNTWFTDPGGVKVFGEQANTIPTTLQLPDDPATAPAGEWIFHVDVCEYLPLCDVWSDDGIECLEPAEGCNACERELCAYVPDAECNVTHRDRCYEWYGVEEFTLTIEDG